MATHAESGSHTDDGAPKELQHHFDTPEQQFQSSKLGMWLFLATEMLMFGGLFCGYAIFRGNNPEIFEWGASLLNRDLGAINTLVLITSSLTMALAVTCAQRGWRWRQVVCLGLTFLGACGFLGIKATEYAPKFQNGLMWGTSFNPNPEYVLAHAGGGHHDGSGDAAHDAEPVVAEPAPVDLEFGKKVAYETCASCHGADLRGMEKNGKSLITSEFVAAKSDEELLAFLKVGRTTFDPLNTTGVQMPPRGGNPTLDDKKLSDVIAFLRVLQANAPAVAPEGDAPASGDGVALDLGPPQEGLRIHKSVLPPAAAPPPGLKVMTAGFDAGLGGKTAAGSPVWPPPPGAHKYFGIYFLMTGLHGIHVVAGMAIIGWLMVGAIRGRYHPGYYTPVDLGGLFWHLVDLIWIFLFPLFYLI